LRADPVVANEAIVGQGCGMSGPAERHSHDSTEELMIRLEGVSKTYPDGTTAVHELSLDVRRGELVVLVGPSGCGKTTTMKMVNRLVEPTGGRIFVDGRDVTNVDPVELRRGIGYVIQNVGLFPHRSIEDNVAVVPELIGWSGRRRRERARELLELVGLDPAVHGGRYPHELSGGQRQRVGLARSLPAVPPVLLMDEPFSAVDPVVRSQLQDEFFRLQDDVRKTILFVTHDIEEAVRLGHRIAVFKQGDPVTEPYRLLRSEEHTSELQSRENLVCRLLLEKKKHQNNTQHQ